MKIKSVPATDQKTVFHQPIAFNLAPSHELRGADIENLGANHCFELVFVAVLALQFMVEASGVRESLLLLTAHLLEFR